jgi:hypothetical protein
MTYCQRRKAGSGQVQDQVKATWKLFFGFETALLLNRRPTRSLRLRDYKLHVKVHFVENV